MPTRSTSLDRPIVAGNSRRGSTSAASLPAEARRELERLHGRQLTHEEVAREASRLKDYVALLVRWEEASKRPALVETRESLPPEKDVA